MGMTNSVRWLTATPERRICLALMALFAMLYIPLAGNYGMWDPWETHYGEVARQMLERNDFVSLWWPGSPQDRAEFWSKPVFTFWLMALGMKAAGLEWGPASPAQEIASSWRAEWGSRIPIILFSLFALWAVWSLVARLAGRRPALWATLVLATSSQWVLITRQAMTDMAFVAPMTIALCLAGLALLLPEEEREADLPRGTLAVNLGGRSIVLSWPRVPAFYLFFGLFVATTLPQLIVFSVQLTLAFRLGSTQVRLLGLVPMLPYFAAFFLGIWWCARATNRRQLYLFTGYVLCALASLAKGPAGVALPAIVLVLYLLVSGRWKEIFTKLEIPRGVVLFVATAFPWYHAMLIRHGIGFWNEFIGDNYVHRAGGRHGDRGQFDYYLQWLGYGMFPWSGLVTLAGLISFKRLREAGPRKALLAFSMSWFLVEFSTMSLVNIKFHHYISPALPALAIVAGLFMDELLSAPKREQALGLLVVAAPITFFCGHDLAAFQPRLLWLFNYDYVNMPGTGRPWPLPSIYGDRYEYGGQLNLFAMVATLGTVALGLRALFTERSAEQPGVSGDSEGAPPVSRTLAVGAGLLVAFAAAILSGPATVNGAAPTVSPAAWLVPAMLMIPALGLVFYLVWKSDRLRSRAAWMVALVAVVWTAFVGDKLLIELSPHWSQKHVIASYFANRKGPEEPLIAWQLYWRGENFYSKNAIYSSSNPSERTVFLNEHNAEKMQQYFSSHAGRRVFFVVERSRFEALRNLLPANAKSTLKVIDESNNKIYLASANI